jgi:cytoskeleton protein RodZ
MVRDGGAEVAPAPLLLGYRGPSWTEIRDRDGQVLIARLIPAGSEQAIRGVPPFDIVIGNAREVTLVYRGTPVDLSRYTRQNVARLRLS